MDSKELEKMAIEEGAQMGTFNLTKSESAAIATKIGGKIGAEDMEMLGFSNNTKMIGSKEEDIDAKIDEEEMKKLKELYRKAMKKKFNTQFRQISSLMLSKGKSLKTIKEEIEQKICNLPHDARVTVMNFKEDALLDYLKDYGVEVETVVG